MIGKKQGCLRIMPKVAKTSAGMGIEPQTSRLQVETLTTALQRPIDDGGSHPYEYGLPP